MKTLSLLQRLHAQIRCALTTGPLPRPRERVFSSCEPVGESPRWPQISCVRGSQAQTSGPQAAQARPAAQCLEHNTFWRTAAWLEVWRPQWVAPPAAAVPAGPGAALWTGAPAPLGDLVLPLGPPCSTAAVHSHSMWTDMRVLLRWYAGSLEMVRGF